MRNRKPKLIEPHILAFELKKYRKINQMRQKDLADKVGVATNTIQRLENCENRVSYPLFMLLKANGVL